MSAPHFMDGLRCNLKEAEEKAIDSLSRYKFIQFGYWAAIWVHLNHISREKHPNPFRALVHEARRMKNA